MTDIYPIAEEPVFSHYSALGYRRQDVLAARDFCQTPKRFFLFMEGLEAEVEHSLPEDMYHLPCNSTPRSYRQEKLSGYVTLMERIRNPKGTLSVHENLDCLDAAVDTATGTTTDIATGTTINTTAVDWSDDYVQQLLQDGVPRNDVATLYTLAQTPDNFAYLVMVLMYDETKPDAFAAEVRKDPERWADWDFEKYFEFKLTNS